MYWHNDHITQMNSKQILENAYDKYSPMLYGIAIEISPTKKQAEEILISTFIKAHRQNIAEQKYPSLYITLIKLIVQTAYEQLGLKKTFQLSAFKNKPLLHKLLCAQISEENYCLENKLPGTVPGKVFYTDFSSAENVKK